MITLTQWDSLYSRIFAWVTRSLKACSDKEALEWVAALRLFYDFENELFNTYEVLDEENYILGLELTAEQLFDITHKYINMSKVHIVRYFIFHWCTELRHYMDGAEPVLDAPWELYQPATADEIKFAREHFSEVTETHYDQTYTHSHTFSDDAQVIVYRNQRFIIDTEWGNAWTVDKKGNVRSFQLEWDWWYPIDEYLDLYNI
jgi:hypothetical protein